MSKDPTNGKAGRAVVGQAPGPSAEERPQAAAGSSEDWKLRTCRVFFEDKHQDLLWVVVSSGVIVDCNLQHWLWCGMEVLQQPKVGQPLHVLWEVSPATGPCSPRLVPGLTRHRIKQVSDAAQPIPKYSIEWLEQNPRAARGLALAGVSAELAAAPVAAGVQS